MVSAFDVAAYILARKGGMSAMKLQKLLYYCQAWSLVWDDTPLFKERIEAWANGPVVRAVYAWQRGFYSVYGDGTLESGARIPGSADVLDASQRETVDAVLHFYGDKNSQWLSDLTHMEPPWRDARADVPDGAPSNREITLEKMAEYYSSIAPTNQA